MSFVVVVSTSSVLYTPPNGSENAFAGQTISSATWNATFTDLSNNGLAVVGKAGPNTFKGNNTSAVAVVADMTVAQAQNLIQQGSVAIALRGVNFNPSVATDNAIPLALGTTRYMIERVAITNANHTLTTASVGLYTATGASGVTVALSQLVTVSSSLADTANGAMVLILNSVSLFAFSDTTLQFRIGVAEGAAATADVLLYVRPM